MTTAKTLNNITDLSCKSDHREAWDTVIRKILLKLHLEAFDRVTWSSSADRVWSLTFKVLQHKSGQTNINIIMLNYRRRTKEERT